MRISRETLAAAYYGRGLINEMEIRYRQCLLDYRMACNIEPSNKDYYSAKQRIEDKLGAELVKMI